MNVGDGQWLSRVLRAQGHEEAAPDRPQDADALLVLTCSVRDKPEQKVYSLLGRLAELTAANPRAFVAVGGCVAQQIGRGFFGRFPSVRLVFGTDGLSSVPQALERLAVTPGLRLSLLDFSEEYAERDQAFPDAGVGPVAFVNIMQGCDNFCAYCIVPHVRGRQRSRASAAVLDECRALLDRGARELVLLGQNVNAYGLDGGGDGTSFVELLYKVAALPGLERLRFTTSHPKDVAPELLRAYAELPQLTSRLHLPVQSGSDAVLARMGRKYTLDHYLRLVEGLNAARPELNLTTDFLVGFPGETEADFQATLAALDTVGFAHSYSFKYSDRPGTASEKFSDKLSEELKTERLAVLQERQQALTEADLAAQVGREVLVLVESRGVHHVSGQVQWSGREHGGRPVNFTVPAGAEADTDLTASLARVRILLAKKHSLHGELAT